jgi:F-type H+-transporting ATPase subunit a
MLFNYVHNPLDQFEIRNFISLDAPLLMNLNISLTNIGLYILSATIIILIFNVIALNKKVVPNA